MLKNLKIDIIYYNTPSDFEFEFNLGGYCRSRILNSKANDLRETLTKLAIAVSRSRVIIIIGEMLGSNGSIAPVAKAISKQLVTVDHHQYHITSPEAINIIEGSLPLVNSNGEFGGCIIESGPQSIIFLSDNKQIRNSIEKELLSHYLTSLSMTSDEENGIVNETETVIAEEESDSVTEQDEITEDFAEEEETSLEEDTNPLVEQENIISLPNAEEVDSQFEEQDFEIEDDIPSEIATPSEESATEITVNEENEDNTIISPKEPTAIIDEFEDFDDGFSSEEYEDEFDEDKAPKKPLSSLSITLIVLFAVLLIVIAAILYFTVYLPSLDGITFFEFINNVFAITKIL